MVTSTQLLEREAEFRRGPGTVEWSNDWSWPFFFNDSIRNDSGTARGELERYEGAEQNTGQESLSTPPNSTT